MRASFWLLFLLASQPLLAGEEREEREEPLRLPEIVVTPTRRNADPFSLPYSISVRGEGEIQTERSPRQLPDLMEGIPGVAVQKTSYGQSSPYIRGFTGYRTLMLVDGIRLNNSVFRPGPNQYWATVDALTVSRLEILKGPASALYGSGAVGGTVNALTRKRDPGDGGGWERRVFFRLASAEHSNTERVELSGLPARNLGFLAGFSRKDYGDLRAGDPTGRQPATGYDERDWDANLVYRFNADTLLTFAHQQVRQVDVPRTHSTVYAESFYGTLVGTDLLRELDQSRDLSYLKLETENAGSFFERGVFTLSRQLQAERQDRIQKAALEVQGFAVETFAASGQLESRAGRGVLTYGGEWSFDRVNSFRGDFNNAGGLTVWRPRGPMADDAYYEEYGFYAQDEFPASDAVDITVGTRYTHAQATAFTVADPFDTLASVKGAEAVHKQWDNLSSNVRLLWKATPEVHSFAGVSQGFRAPNLVDLTQFDEKRSGEVNVPSTDLEPEEYLTKEVGLKSRREGVSWQAVYYHTEIQDAIERTPTGELSGTSPVVKRQNVGNGFVQGVELEGAVEPAKDWRLFGSAQWQEGTVDTFVTSDPADKDKRPMSRIAPRSALLGVRRNLWEARKGWAEATGSFTHAQDRLSPDDKLDKQRIPPYGTPGYDVFTVRLGLEAWKGTTVTAAVENVTDKDYRVLGSGTNSPGRNLVLVFDARF